MYQALPQEHKPALKFKFPRADDTSTTSESEDDRLTHKTVGATPPKGFKLVVSNGKIIR